MRPPATAHSSARPPGSGQPHAATVDFASAGAEIRTVQVRMAGYSLRLFSGGLYASPSKAIEELVTNSYDAMATHVAVLLPSADERRLPSAAIWVVDDGEGMTADGLQELWWIGKSPKRAPGSVSRPRQPIGRFGIGKLATYLLAHELTYVTHREGRYLAVTINYDKFETDRDLGAAQDALSVRELTVEVAGELLAGVVSRLEDVREGCDGVPADHPPLRLFGPGAAPSWTVACLGRLRDNVELQIARTEHVLRTALPLQQEFCLYLNERRLVPPKLAQVPLKTWVFGLDDAVAVKKGWTAYPDDGAVDVPGVGRVAGRAEIYTAPLTTAGKPRYERDHGIFVRVRQRLLNLDDELFGLSAVSHASFVRFRAVLDADGLDELLRATRESVLETPAVTQLRSYVLAKFNEARTFYETWLEDQHRDAAIATRLGHTSASLSRQPLLDAIAAVVDDSGAGELVLTRVPRLVTSSERAAFLQRLGERSRSDRGLIDDVRVVDLGAERPIAEFDAESGQLSVNEAHPFRASFVAANAAGGGEAFELLAVADVLTEAYLREAGVQPADVRDVLARRDRFLRELAASRQLEAPRVARLLEDAAAFPVLVPAAVVQGFLSLGFEVTPIAGSRAEPDGLATAPLGVRDDGVARSATYRVVFDARAVRMATRHRPPSAADVARLRQRYASDYAVLIMPSEAAAVGGSLGDEVTTMTLPDLGRLVLTASSRALGLDRIRDLLATARDSEGVQRWIDAVLAEPPRRLPLAEILEAIWDLQSSRPERVRIAALPVATDALRALALRTQEVGEWLQTLRRLAGPIVTVDGAYVSLERPPADVLGAIQGAVNSLPRAFRAAAVRTGLADDPAQPDPAVALHPAA